MGGIPRMTIEERAEKWAREYAREMGGGEFTEQDLVGAYLAGSEQTQKDYVAYIMERYHE
jgi:hypothetical protein